MEKAIPIHGVQFTKSIIAPLKIRHILNEEYIYFDEIQFWTYNDFTNFVNQNVDYFINNDEIKKCDSIAVYTSQSHNTMEVFNIKLLISALYFCKRLTDTHELKEKFISGYIKKLERLGRVHNHTKLVAIANEVYNNQENEFFKNYMLDGYWTAEYISCDKWYIKLGNSKLTRDDFDRSIVRCFSSTLCDEYDRQAEFVPRVVRIEPDEIFISKLSILLNKINGQDEYSKKLKAVLKIYYEVLEEINIDTLIILYGTILESLLLKRTEQNAQKVRVAVRSACIVADKQCKDRKTFIANTISYMYTYRNQIVHEGKSFLELDDEVTLSRILRSTKHVIYFIIKYIIENNINSVDEIISVVENNLASDDLENGQDYITFRKGDSVEIIYIED